MARQEASREGGSPRDKDSPSRAVRAAADGQASSRGTGMAPDFTERQPRPRKGEEQGRATGATPGRKDEGDGPGKVGLTSDQQPDLVAPSGVNQRDHGVADDKPMAGGSLNFDDGTDMLHPRGKVTGEGGTWNDKNPSDAGELGTPDVGMSDRNGPSDPDAKRNR